MRGIKKNTQWKEQTKYAVREKGSYSASGYGDLADKIILFDSLEDAIEYANNDRYSTRDYIQEIKVWIKIEKLEVKKQER